MTVRFSAPVQQVRLRYIGQSLRYEKSTKTRAEVFFFFSDIFSSVEINAFLPVFAVRLKMHVRCDNQYKTEADRGTILGQPMTFEWMGICVLSPADECGMRASLVYLHIVKCLLILLNSATEY